jgi:DNA primase
MIPGHLIEQARSVRIEDLIAERGIKLRGTVDRCGPCPRCQGEDRFSIHVGKQVFNCRQCGAKGDVIGLTQFLDDCNFATAIETLSGARIGRPHPEPQEAPPALGPIKAAYDYVDESGELLFQALRFEPPGSPKQFRQRRGPDQKKWSIESVRIVPFRLPELIEDLSLGRMIFIVEGEKDVITLRDLNNVAATTNPMGAGKWRESFNEIFRDADVVVCGDNDKPGRDHVELVAKNLHGVAKRVRVLDLPRVWPHIAEGDDISDWFDRGGGTVDRRYEIVDELQDWAPKINGVAVPRIFDSAGETELSIAPFSEVALAERFVERHPSLRFVAAWGKWMLWTQGRIGVLTTPCTFSILPD